jgi:hypothetical protein
MLKERTAPIEKLYVSVGVSLDFDVSPPELQASIRRNMLDTARRDLDNMYPGRQVIYFKMDDEIKDEQSQPMRDFIEGKPPRRMLVGTVRYALVPE